MAGGRRCILVIEDDPETAEQLVDTLATNGYQVDLSIDGNDGLARGRSVDYTVMTIDRGVASIGHAASPGELRLFFSFSNMLFACVDAWS
jgi:two-component system, OmpR family, response regulator